MTLPATIFTISVFLCKLALMLQMQMETQLLEVLAKLISAHQLQHPVALMVMGVISLFLQISLLSKVRGMFMWQ
jgi:hypothetical protein